MIQCQKMKNGATGVCGCGYIALEPKITQIGKIRKCELCVNYSYTNQDGSPQWNMVHLGAYETRKTSPFELCTKLHRGEIVDFKGTLRRTSYISQTGEKRQAMEVVLESLIPVRRLTKILFPDIGNVEPQPEVEPTSTDTGSDDGYAF